MKHIPFASRVLSRLRETCARSGWIEFKLDVLLQFMTQLEKTMSDNQSAILAKLDALKAQAETYTTDQGNRLAEAVAAARAAQAKDDKAASDAEMAEALAKIEEIGKGLVTFSPSGM